MNPEYYALKLQNGETLVPSAKELDRVFRDNVKAVRSMGAAMPAHVRRFLRACAPPKPAAKSRPLRLHVQPKPKAKPIAKKAPEPKRDYLAFLDNLPRRRTA